MLHDPADHFGIQRRIGRIGRSLIRVIAFFFSKLRQRLGEGEGRVLLLLQDQLLYRFPGFFVQAEGRKPCFFLQRRERHQRVGEVLLDEAGVFQRENLPHLLLRQTV